MAFNSDEYLKLRKKRIEEEEKKKKANANTTKTTTKTAKTTTDTTSGGGFSADEYFKLRNERIKTQPATQSNDIAPVKTTTKSGVTVQNNSANDYSTVNLSNLEREIANIENQINEIGTRKNKAYWDAYDAERFDSGRSLFNPDYKSKEKTEEEKLEAEYNALQSQLSQKKSLYGEAKRYQDGLKLTSDAIQSADFKEKSAYNEKEDDITYQYINNPDNYSSDKLRNNLEFFRKRRHSSTPTSKGKEVIKAEKNAYEQMEDYEVAVYNYYYATKGKEQANKYLESLADTLYERKSNKIAEDKDGKVAEQILYGAEVNLDRYGEGVASFINPKDEYAPVNATQRAGAKVRGDLADDGFKVLGSSLGQIGYDLVGTTAYMAPSILTSAVVGTINPTAGAVVGAGLMGASAKGNAYQEMINNGYDKKQAHTYSTLVGISEAGLQYALGGISKLGGGVTSKALTGAVAKIDSGIMRFALTHGGKMLSEGFEEAAQEVLDPIFENIALGYEKNTLEDVDWEQVVYSGLLGALSAGAMEINSSVQDSSKGAHYEAKVADKIYKDAVKQKEEQDGRKLTFKEKKEIQNDIAEQLERGEISLDTIEETLGGDTYKSYKDVIDKEEADLKELAELYEGDELKQQVEDYLANSKRNEIGSQLSNEVFELVKDSKLANSYFEKTKRSKTFEADLSQYEEKYHDTIKRAVDSGILNDTRRTHEFVDLIAKLSADKGVSFDFANNEKIAGTRYAVEGRTVNGYVDENNNIVLNIDSPKALNSTVGHEITHILEDTDLYETFKDVAIEYAKSRKSTNSKFTNEYFERLDNAIQLYKDIDSYKGKDGYEKIKREVVADLVGDYIFTDEAFVRKLSTEHRNIFEKIYDEIKYLCKIATAGSKEARQLEKVKRTFEEVYRGTTTTESGTAQKKPNVNTKYSLSAADNTYLSAVEKGDTETAQRLVDEAAKKNGYTRKMFHETDAENIHIFDTSLGTHGATDSETPYGIFTKSSAKNIGLGSKQMALYVKADNTLYVDDRTDVKNKIPELIPYYDEIARIDREYAALAKELEDAEFDALQEWIEENPDVDMDEVYPSSYIIENKPADIDSQEYLDAHSKYNQVMEEWKSEYNKIAVKCKELITSYLENNGYDSMYFKVDGGSRGRSTDSLILLDSNQVKNTDAVTYDDNGNIIPLSERFNESNDDIRYSLNDNLENVGKILYDNNNPLAIVNRAKSQNYSSIKWVYESEIFSVTENKRFHEKISEINQGSQAFEKNSRGEYMLPIENKIIFTNGNYDYPYIREIIEVLTEYQTEFEEIRGRIFDVEKGKSSKQYAVRTITQVFGDGNIVTYRSGNNGVYDWQNGKRKGKTRRTVVKNYLIKQYRTRNDNQIQETKVGSNESAFSIGENTKYSLSYDTEGRNLSTQQQNYFKKSKIVDENGNLKVVYHGTRKADFTVFKRNINYFTDSKEMADSYSPNGEKFVGYLNITKPYEIDAKGEKWSQIPIDDEMANFLREYGASVFEEKGKWRTTPADISSAIEEAIDNGDVDYDGVIIKNIDDTGSYYKGNEKHLGTDYIVFNSNQFKTIDNKTPTSNRDITRSLSAENEQPTKQTGLTYGEDVKFTAPIREDVAKTSPTESAVVEEKATPPVAPIKATEREAIKPAPEELQGEEKERANNKMARADKGKAEQVAKILTDEPAVEKKKRGLWSYFKESVLDKGMVFETLSKKTKNRELEAKWNFIRYADGNAQTLIGKGAEGVKALKDIQAEVEKTGHIKEFYEYLYHKHNVDRMNLEGRYDGIKNKPVFGYSVTSEASQKIVNQYESAEPKFKDYAQDVYDYMNHLRNMMVDNGVISQETADLWAEMYPHYVPIRRVGDTGLNINVPLDTGRTSVNAPVKASTGGSRDILPLFDTMAQRTMQTFKAVAKNSFGVELKNTLGTIVKSDMAKLDDIIDGIDTQEDLLQEGKNGNKPTFTVFENGERVTFEITDEMYDALKPKGEKLAYRNKFLKGASALQRNLLTEYNPVFMLTNAIKDVQDVLINSQHAFKTYANFPKAIAEMVSKGKYYTEYMSNGGGQNTYFDNESNTFTKDKKLIRKIVGMPLDIISGANNVIERLPRVAEYIASRKDGRSIEVSMLDAARVTTNFAAGGDVTKFLNGNGCTFLNASVQGAIQQVRNIREAKMNGLKGWVGLATKYALVGIPAMILNQLMWDDDEEYEELSDYVKENYYIVAKRADGKFVRIPKGRALAVIQNAMEQIKNAATGDDDVDLKSFLELAVSNLAPNNPIDNNIIAPLTQVAKNKTWYGEDLVPTRLQDLPKNEQFDESTDAISKWLGEKQNILSPYQINYLLNQYSGGVGDVVLPMLTPEAESGDNSVVGNLIAPLKDKFTTDSVMNNQNVSDFYETVDNLKTNANSSKATDEDILKYKYMNSVNAELGELYQQKREIQNGSLSDKDKYSAVRKIQEQIDELAKESLNKYNNVTVEGKYAYVDDHRFRWKEPGETSDEEAGWEKITDKQYAKQNKVTASLHISPSEYWSDKERYDYAYDNPQKYALAKAVGGYDTYKTYSGELYDIKADKDSNGKSISGSRKEKVLDYINSLDLDYGQKLILYKSLYETDDRYNYEIVDYLNGRDDISYDEMVSILKELGFTVLSDGSIQW